MDVFWKILATLGLVALNGYFVAAEFAAVGARLTRLQTDAPNSYLARMALKIKVHLDLYLSTCQLGITIASLGLGAVTEPAIAVLLDPLMSKLGLTLPETGHHALSITIALVIATVLHVVVGEVAPKNYAIFFPDKLLPILAPPLVIFTKLFYPLIWLLNSASNQVLRLTGIKLDQHTHGGLPHTEDEIRGLLRQAIASGTIAHEQSAILLSAIEFGDLLVRQIMTPRINVNFLLIDQPMSDILKTIKNSEYSRLPLCKVDVDHIVGFVHVKDVFAHLVNAATPTAPTTIDLQKIRREVMFVPELLPVHKLLRQLQESRKHMAVIVDEYGTMTGIVTMEDILEQIVGEIDDEHDTATGDFVIVGNQYRVSGSFPLHELRLKLNLPEEIEHDDIDTLSGYITHELGRLPRLGDTINIGNMTARVLTLHRRRIGVVMLMVREIKD